MASPLVIIDGDILVYACGVAAEKGQYVLTYGGDQVEYIQYKRDVKSRLAELGNPAHTLEFERVAEPVEYALHNVKELIGGILTELAVSDYVVVLSGPTNFRTDIATIREYKGNRDKAHKPVHGPAIREYLTSRHPSIVSDNEEADDLAGYTHYARYLNDPESSILATQDKDLNMIPGWHYNFAKKEKYFIDDVEADFNFYRQLLTGDPTDNIQGVPGIGKAKAEKLLRNNFSSAREMYEIVQAVYNDDDALLENARLLWIRRHPGEMWEPPDAVH